MRWFNMKETEKIVGQAEKDLEKARLRLEVSFFSVLNSEFNLRNT